MSKIKQYVISARNGDKEAFEYLVKYYEPYFCEKVVKQIGRKYENQAKETVRTIIKYYLDNNIKINLVDFVRERTKSFINGKTTLKMAFNSDKDRFIKYYSDKIYKELKDKKGILTKAELQKFCNDFLISKIDNFIDKKDFQERTIFVISRLNKKIANEEELLIEYVKYEGLDNKILNYFVNKYKYIIENSKYKIYEKEFDKIIIDCLEKRYNQNFSRLLESRVKEKYKEDREKARELSKKDKLTNEEINFIKDVYSYYKSIFFERYHGIIDDEVLKQIIDKKYNYFIDLYLSGPKSRELSQALNDKMTMFFSLNAYLQTIKNEDSIYLIERYKEKYECYYPIETELLKVYEECIIKYYTKKRKSNIHEYIRVNLKNRAKELSKYDITYIDDTTYEFKQKDINIIDKEIKEEVIDGFRNYYIENKIYEKKTYDRYLFEEFLNYDENMYKEVFDYKKHDSNKVLKRPIKK